MTTSSPTSLEELDREADKLPDFTSAHPCPDYCNLPAGHKSDSIHTPDDTTPLRQSRGHEGPMSQFGPYVTGGSTEFADEPGTFHAVVWVDLSRDFDRVEDLLTLGEQIANGAQWLLEQKRKAQA